MSSEPKPGKMKVEPTAEPGAEFDAKGNPIPVSQRTAEHRAQAIGSASVKAAVRKPSGD